MTEVLERQYDLVVLKIRLDTSQPDTRVVYEIQVKIGGEPRTQARWECLTEEMGIPSRIDRQQAMRRGYNFTIAEHVIAGVAAWLERESTVDTPLWLHLARPYGYLGMVPWERVLQPRCRTPILRLPEYVVQPPRETPSALDVLLCCSAPEAKAPFPIIDHLTPIVRRIAADMQRRTHFHVFVDSASRGALEHALAAEGLLGTAATVYDPGASERFAPPDRNANVPEELSHLTNPWLLWMREALHGTSVDVAHFVCHGYLSGDRGALSFAESPVSNADTRMARFVGAAELRTFLTHVGAWSAVFSAPVNNYSPMGLRQLADAVGQSRPGPLVHHEFELDGDATALSAAYRLLCARTPQPAPASPALFIYCQPFRVQSAVDTGERTLNAAFAAPTLQPELDSLFASQENVPSWVAASERYVEQCELRVQKLRPDTTESGSSAERKGRSAASLESTLRDIRSIIARVASATQSGGVK